jgi:hypothetical protein
LNEREQGVRGQVEVTPSTAIPGLQEGRPVLQLNHTHLTGIQAHEIPTVWQDIIYLLTPPGIEIAAPIFNLNYQILTEEQMAFLELRVASNLEAIAHAEHYVGLAGVHPDPDSDGFGRVRTSLSFGSALF